MKNQGRLIQNHSARGGFLLMCLLKLILKERIMPSVFIRMKKYLYIASIVSASVAMIIPGITLAATTPTTTNQNYCGDSATTTAYGYVAYTSANTYTKKDTVSFCLKDNTRSPLFSNLSWEVLNEKGKVVYASGSITPPFQPTSYTYFSIWDENNSKDKQVKPGTYTIVFTQYPTTPSVTFTIVK